MTILVTDTGFTPDTWDKGYTAFGEAANDVLALDVPSDTNPDDRLEICNNPSVAAPISKKAP